MHPLARLLGWCLLVALLTGILWPERPDEVQATSMEVQPEVATQRPLPPTNGPPTGVEPPEPAPSVLDVLPFIPR